MPNQTTPHDAKIGRIEARLDSLADNVNSLASSLKQLANDVHLSRRPQWGLVVSSCSLLLAVGAAAASLISKDVNRLEVAQVTHNEELRVRSRWMGVAEASLEQTAQILERVATKVDGLDVIEESVSRIDQELATLATALREEARLRAEPLRAELDAVVSRVEALGTQYADRFTRSNWEREEDRLLDRIREVEKRLP